MTNAVATHEQEPAITAIEKAVYQGNIAELTPEQRVTYVNELCNSVGLNPLTRPMEYITLQGKLTLYVTRSGTDQLRKINGVSIIGIEAEERDGLYIVTATATDEDGRQDTDTGIVSIAGKKGEDYANAVMKATTKAKRRVTLSICGLGFLDESETGGGREPTPQRDIEPPRAITSEPQAAVVDGETGEYVDDDAPNVDPDDAWREVQEQMKAQNVTASRVAKVIGTTFTKDNVVAYLTAHPDESPDSIVNAAAS